LRRRGPGFAPEAAPMEIVAILTLVVSIIYTFAFIYFEAMRRC
jgi:hypothetical protein